MICDDDDDDPHSIAISLSCLLQKTKKKIYEQKNKNSLFVTVKQFLLNRSLNINIINR